VGVRALAVRIALVALVAAAVVLSPVVAGATPSRQPLELDLSFQVRGDLGSVSGQVSSHTCLKLPAPDPFSIGRNGIEHFVLGPPSCERAELEWRIRTHPKSSRDPSESFLIVVHYTERSIFPPWLVECRPQSPDVKCYATGDLSNHFQLVELVGS